MLENTDLAYGLVVSTDRLDGRITVRQFSPAAVFSDTGTGENLMLAPRDTVLVFSRPGANDALKAESEAEDALEARTIGQRSRTGAGMDRAAFGMFAEAEAEDEDEDEAEAEASSREVLLAPVLAQLDRQASPASPVAHSSHRGRCAGARALSSGARTTPSPTWSPQPEAFGAMLMRTALRSSEWC